MSLGEIQVFIKNLSYAKISQKSVHHHSLSWPNFVFPDCVPPRRGFFPRNFFCACYGEGPRAIPFFFLRTFIYVSFKYNIYIYTVVTSARTKTDVFLEVFFFPRLPPRVPGAIFYSTPALLRARDARLRQAYTVALAVDQDEFII